MMSFEPQRTGSHLAEGTTKDTGSYECFLQNILMFVRNCSVLTIRSIL